MKFKYRKYVGPIPQTKHGIMLIIGHFLTGVDTGRVDPRVGSGRVGSGRVGSEF